MSMIINRQPGVSISNLGHWIRFELDGMTLLKRLVETAFKYDIEISRASPVGHFLETALPDQVGQVNVKTGERVVVKVLTILDSTESVPKSAAK